MIPSLVVYKAGSDGGFNKLSTAARPHGVPAGAACRSAGDLTADVSTTSTASPTATQANETNAKLSKALKMQQKELGQHQQLPGDQLHNPSAAGHASKKQSAGAQLDTTTNSHAAGSRKSVTTTSKLPSSPRTIGSIKPLKLDANNISNTGTKSGCNSPVSRIPPAPPATPRAADGILAGLPAVSCPSPTAQQVNRMCALSSSAAASRQQVNAGSDKKQQAASTSSSSRNSNSNSTPADVWQSNSLRPGLRASARGSSNNRGNSLCQDSDNTTTFAHSLKPSASGNNSNNSAPCSPRMQKAVAATLGYTTAGPSASRIQQQQQVPSSVQQHKDRRRAEIYALNIIMARGDELCVAAFLAAKDKQLGGSVTDCLAKDGINNTHSSSNTNQQQQPETTLAVAAAAASSLAHHGV
eukprot:GHRR01002088.1.p1 GENE.GHRR01002088.1~~GHRR01002088.1.p1  ORF type:complete len:412 (+),score=175.14 GHRR01002088.1:1618-2853(+)